MLSEMHSLNHHERAPHSVPRTSARKCRKDPAPTRRLLPPFRTNNSLTRTHAGAELESDNDTTNLYVPLPR